MSCIMRCDSRGGEAFHVEELTEAAADAPGGAVATARPAPEHVDPDQETLDRVLAEELAKGTDRRVAEGRARAAAIRAARKKAAEG